MNRFHVLETLARHGLTNDTGDSFSSKNRGKTQPYCTSMKCAGYDPRSKARKNLTDRMTMCPDCGSALIYDFPCETDISDKRRK